MASRCPFSGAVGAEAGPAWTLSGLAGAAMRRLGGAFSRCPVTGAVADAPNAETAAESAPEPAPGLDGAARLRGEARELLDILRGEGMLTAEAGARRLAEIEAEIAVSGTYEHTSLELEYGAKLAWRNAARCLGRLYWQDLTVRDLRHVTSAEAVFAELVEHLILATNGGKVRPTITVFAPRVPGEPGARIWNPQLIRYAGYRQPDGSVIGDPAQVEFTEVVRGLGWAGGLGTPFDVLPIVIQMPGEEPRLFELPPEAVLEVPLEHPDHPWFAELGLKWHAVPAIANMRMEIGGVSYTAAPFNGWYMGTEIGARNLADEDRYNLLPVIAERMGLETRTNRSLWRDRAIVELNVAVLHSFQRARVTVIDHHTASRHFLRHEEHERQAGRFVPGDWTWLIPPISASTSPVWSRPYRKVTVKPAYLAQRDPWKQPAAASQPVAAAPLAEASDELTGLRRSSSLAGGLGSLGRRGGAVAVFDLDEFALVNAEHGSKVGDAALRAVGRAILGVLRPEDVCIRTGGDEMTVLLSGIEDPRDAANVAQRVRAAVGAVYLKDAPWLTIRASMGIALCAPGHDPAIALARAQEGMRRAKLGGRDAAVLMEDGATLAAESLAA
jgi:nitric-oxide synthase